MSQGGIIAALCANSTILKGNISLPACDVLTIMPRSSLRRLQTRKTFLSLELLEDRRLLATFSPQANIFDGNPGSLREAIIASNGNSQDDTINLGIGWYRMGLNNVNGSGQENAAATGDFDLTEAGRTVTIQGKGAGTIIDADEVDRVFQVFPNVRVVLKDLSLRGGLATDDGIAGHNGNNSIANRAGGILTAAGSSLTLTNVSVENCLAGSAESTLSAEGGGIYAAGAVVITNTLFLNNRAVAGYRTATSVSLAQGGAIAVVGSTPLQVTGSVFVNNSAAGGSDGGLGAGLARGGAIAAHVNVNIGGSTFNQNIAIAGSNETQAEGADSFGGALFVNGNATLTQTDFTNNSARGGITYDTTVVGRGGDAFGGAIFAKGITGNRGKVEDNSAIGGSAFHRFGGDPGGSGGDGGSAAGGGIYVTANSSFTDLTLVDNDANGGPGNYGVSAGAGSTGDGGQGGNGGRADGGAMYAAARAR